MTRRIFQPFDIIANSMSEWSKLDGRLLVIFDGYCGLCNRAIRWFLRRDARDSMRFASSQTPQVSVLLVQLGIVMQGASDGPGSIVVVRGLDSEKPQVYLRSDAVIAMLRVLTYSWPVLASILWLIPRPLRDWGYGLIARWRYRIWGRLEACPLPTEQEQARFL